MGVLNLSNRRKKKVQNVEHLQDEVKEEIPIEILGEYTDNLNILMIDSYIRRMFEGKIKILKEKEEEIAKLQKEIDNFSGFKIDYLSLLDKKKKLESEVRICFDEDKKTYHKETVKILEDFKPLNVKYCSIKTAKKQKSEANEIENIKIARRLQLIEDYLSVAKKYIHINFIRGLRQSCGITCESCGESINCNEETVCACGLLLPVISKLTSFKDANRTSANYGQVYYEDLKNFTKALHAFQGIQSNKENIIPKNLFGKLDEYFTGMGRQKGEHYRNLQCLANGKKKGTSFQDLILALDKMGYSEQYNNAHLIAKEYWGWRLPDLSEHEDQIIDDYNKVQRIWDEEKDRDSSPNVKIRLYLHLRARGIPVLREDFKFPVTSSCINYYNDRLKPIFETCGLKYENLI